MNGYESLKTCLLCRGARDSGHGSLKSYRPQTGQKWQIVMAHSTAERGHDVVDQGFGDEKWNWTILCNNEKTVSLNYMG